MTTLHDRQRQSIIKLCSVAGHVVVDLTTPASKERFELAWKQFGRSSDKKLVLLRTDGLMWSVVVSQLIDNNVLKSEYANSFGLRKPALSTRNAITWFQDMFRRTYSSLVSDYTYHDGLEEYDRDQRFTADRVLHLIDPTLDENEIPSSDLDDGTLIVRSCVLTPSDKDLVTGVRSKRAFLTEWHENTRFRDRPINERVWDRDNRLLAFYLFSPYTIALAILSDESHEEIDKKENIYFLDFVSADESVERSVFLGRVMMNVSRTLRVNVGDSTNLTGRDLPHPGGGTTLVPTLEVGLPGFVTVELFWDDENRDLLIPLLEGVKVSRTFVKESQAAIRKDGAVLCTTMILRRLPNDRQDLGPSRVNSDRDVETWRTVMLVGCCTLCSAAIWYSITYPDGRRVSVIEGLFVAPSPRRDLMSLHASLLLSHLLFERILTFYRGRLSSYVLAWGIKPVNTNNQYEREYVLGWNMLDGGQYWWVRNHYASLMKTVPDRHYCKDDTIDERSRVSMGFVSVDDTTRYTCLKQGLGGGLRSVKKKGKSPQ